MNKILVRRYVRRRAKRRQLNEPMHTMTTNQRLLSQYEIGWVSGIIDGEGYITLHKAHDVRYRRGFSWNPKISASNTNRDIVDRLKAIVGAGSIRKKEYETEKWKAVYEWTIAPSAMRGLLPQLQLVGKKRQADLVSEALQLLEACHGANQFCPPMYDKRLEEIYLEIKQLNKRGP